MTRIERWIWIHATCRQGWRRIPLPWFLIFWWGERELACGHPLNELDDYGCGVCDMKRLRRPRRRRASAGSA